MQGVGPSYRKSERQATLESSPRPKKDAEDCNRSDAGSLAGPSRVLLAYGCPLGLKAPKVVGIWTTTGKHRTLPTLWIDIPNLLPRPDAHDESGAGRTAISPAAQPVRDMRSCNSDRFLSNLCHSSFLEGIHLLPHACVCVCVCVCVTWVCLCAWAQSSFPSGACWLVDST